MSVSDWGETPHAPDSPMTMRVRWLGLQPGIYLKKGHVCDNDGLGDPAEDIFEVLMWNNGRWWFFGEDLGGDEGDDRARWLPCFDNYDPTADGPLFRISGPGMTGGVMSIWRVEVK